jgi:putative addiction module killer protein
MNKLRNAVYFKDLKKGLMPAYDRFQEIQDLKAKSQIFVRIRRAELGNFGDYKYLGNGILEMRIHLSPGYRIYFALVADEMLILQI